MRKIKYIVLHCTAGPQTQTVEAILNYWRKNLGWKNPGYHHLIKSTGEVVNLLPIEQVANGVAGYNQNSIHIAYIGGVDRYGNAQDNRTTKQEEAQLRLLEKYRLAFPAAEIKGHRDFPGVKKACPSFNVKKWLAEVGFKKQ